MSEKNTLKNTLSFTGFDPSEWGFRQSSLEIRVRNYNTDKTYKRLVTIATEVYIKSVIIKRFKSEANSTKKLLNSKPYLFKQNKKVVTKALRELIKMLIIKKKENKWKLKSAIVKHINSIKH